MSKGIPQSFIDELVAQIDIVEVIDGLVPLKKTGSSYSCCCPFHQEKTPSFHVIPQKQFFYCFGCGASGNCIKFLMLYSHLEFPDAIQHLAEIAGMQIPLQTGKPETNSRQEIQILEKINQLYQQNLNQAAPAPLNDYLHQRDLNTEMIKNFQLGYAPEAWHYLSSKFPQQQAELIRTGMLVQQDKQKPYDRFRHRLIFPLINRKGLLIGFAGRVIHPEHKPKYMNPPETPLFHKQKELYGLYQVLEKSSKPPYIIVVEGYLDVIALFQFGLPYAVATMGTATSNHHLNTLHKFTDKLIFCFDGDDAGRQAAWRALETCMPNFHLFKDLRFLFLPDGEDPDSFVRRHGKMAFESMIKSAINLPQYVANHLQELHGKNNPMAWIPEAKRLLNQAEEGPGKELIIEALSQISRLDPYRLHQLLRKEQNHLPTKVQAQDSLSTALRLALSLIIQKPSLWQHLKHQQKTSIIYPQPLGEIFSLLQNNLNLSAPMILERFRGSAFENIINNAMIMEHHVNDAQELATLSDSLDFLTQQANKEKIEHFLQKLRSHGLTEVEKQELQELLKNKHKSKVKI
jgi:DNA primase